PQGFRDQRPFESGIEVTSITATVTDAEGHLITGLPREAFEVYEDGEKQEVTQFTRDRVPIGLGVLLDISDSMYGRRIEDARAAVDRFLFDLLDPSDEFFLMAFNHRPRPLTGWTRAHADVQRALAGLQPTGGTAIYDAIIEAMPLVNARTRIAEELNSQYVLGYSSPRGPDGQFHSIRVKIRAAGGGEYRVRARNGYIATPVFRRSKH